MTAITQRLLHLRLVCRPHLYTLHHFSSSSDAVPPSNIPPPESESEPGPKASFSSYFSEVRATLQREPQTQNRPQSPRKPLSFSNSPQTPPPSKSAYLDEIRRNLTEYRTRSAPNPPSSTAGQYVSLQELYKRNVIAKDNDAATSSNNSAEKPPSSRSFDAIRDSLFNLRSNSRFRESLNLKPGQNAGPGSPRILGGGEGLPSFFGKEKNVGGNDGGGSKMRTGLVRMYNYSELGTKLKMLRPEKKKGKGFSLHELNERLAKLKEMEEKESQGIVAGISWKDLRDTMVTLTHSEEEKMRKKTSKFLFSQKISFSVMMFAIGNRHKS